MFPRLFTIPAFDLLGREWGPIVVPTYGVILAVAFIVGLWIVARQARASGLDPALVTDLGVWALIGGLVGAKLLLVVVDWPHYAKNPKEIFSLLRSAGVFYGGLLGGIGVAVWYMRRHRLPAWPTIDVLAPGVALAQAIGRFGCLAAGCCWGRYTDVPWAITFRDEYAAQTIGTPLHTPLHPSQIYESLAAGLIFVVLVLLSRRKRFHGQVAVSYVMLYAATRFGLEYFRGDSARGFVFGGILSTSQFIGILLFLGAAAFLPYLHKKNRLPAAA